MSLLRHPRRFRPLSMILWVAGLMLATNRAACAEEGEAALHLIQTSATAKEQLAPDSASVFLDVVAQAGTVEQAHTETVTRISSVLEALKRYGWKELTTETSQVTIEPVYEQRQTFTDLPRVVGHKVTYALMVQLEGLAGSTLAERVASVLDEGLKHGANRVRGPTFYVNDPEPIRKRLLAQATAEVAQRAQVMAEAAGVKIVRLHRLQDQGQFLVPYQDRFKGMAMAETKAASTPIEVGEQEISVTVSASYEVGSL